MAMPLIEPTQVAVSNPHMLGSALFGHVAYDCVGVLSNEVGGVAGGCFMPTPFASGCIHSFDRRSAFVARLRKAPTTRCAATTPSSFCATPSSRHSQRYGSQPPPLSPLPPFLVWVFSTRLMGGCGR
jgi:hypothetical protein